MAIAGLILGVLSLTTGLLPLSILAIIFGAISRKRFIEGYHERGGMAKAAIILGVIGVVLLLVYFAVILALTFM